MAYKANISKAWKSAAKHGTHVEWQEGEPHEGAESKKHKHQKVDDASTGKQRIVTTLQGGTSYTPPVRTPAGDEAYAKLSEAEKKAQDEKYIKENTITLPDTQSIADIPSSGGSGEIMGENTTTTTTGGYMDVAEPWQVRQQNKKLNKYRRGDAKNVRKQSNYINKLIKKGVDIDAEIAGGNQDVIDALSITGGYNKGGKKRKGFLGLGGQAGDWVSTTSERTVGEGADAKTYQAIKQRSESGKALDSGHRENVYSHNPGQYKIKKADYGNINTEITTTESKDPNKGYKASTTWNSDQTDIDNANPNAKGHWDDTTNTWIPKSNDDGDKIANNVNDNKDTIVGGSWSQNMGAGYDNQESVAVRGTRKTKSNRRKNRYTQGGPNWHNS